MTEFEKKLLDNRINILENRKDKNIKSGGVLKKLKRKQIKAEAADK